MRLTAVSALLVLGFAGAGTAHAAAEDDLLEMSDLLDRADKQDFLKYIDKANACTQSFDFACADSQLAKAGKLARIARDRQALASAQRNLASTREAEELRLRAEEKRQLALDEERIRVAQAARNAEEGGPSTASLLLQFGGLVAKNYAINKAAANAARAVDIPPATNKPPTKLPINKTTGNDFNGNRGDKAFIAMPPDKLAIMNRWTAGSQPSTPGVSSAPQNLEVLQDRYSNKVTSTGITKTYDKHDGDISQVDLSGMKKDFQLHAIKCLGTYYVTGNVPSVKGLSCYNLAYEAICPTGQTITGEATNLRAGKSSSCANMEYVYQLYPAPSCSVKELNVRVTDVQPGCK